MLETGWLADFVYYGGEFHSGVAMFAGADGRITCFSREPEDLRRSRRLAGRAILPGMVNAHSHTFQRVIRGRTEHKTAAQRDTFWTWREAMYHAANRLSPEDVYHAARMAFIEMLAAGITTVGEFHYLHRAPDGSNYAERALLSHRVLDAARECGIRIVLLVTAYVRAGWKKEPDPGQIRFLSPTPDDFLRLMDAVGTEAAMAPHSIRAVPVDYLKEILPFAREHGMRVHMHVAEQPAEVEASLGEYGRRPVELLLEHGVIDAAFTGVHVIHVTDDEVARFAVSGATVCACPTTERNLGDGIGPADDLLRAGGSICFGTDSNAQIDLFEDARQLEYHLRLKKLERAVLAEDGDRESLARRLFHCATESGARSLGVEVGALEVGRPADFFTVDLEDLSIAGSDQGSLLSNVVFAAGRAAIRDVFVGGRAVIEDGLHRLREEIVREFTNVQRRLWT